MNLNTLVWGCIVVASAVTAGNVGAAQFPAKPIRLVASGIGGTGDFASRLISPHLTSRLGQTVIVENRPGGIVPGQIVATAQPDGHTLMMVGAVIWLAPFMLDAAPFDPVRDFAPITMAVESPNVLVVHPSLPVKTVQDLVALAKQKPGTLNMASSGVGNSNHLAGEIFKAMANVDIVGIAYKGAPLALNDVIGGRVQLMFATINASKPHVSSGRLRAIAVTSERPTQLFAGLPTIASAGLPGYESAATLGLLSRAGTPRPIIELLHREVVQFLRQPATSELLFNAGIDVVASTPQAFAAMIKTEMQTKGKIVRSAGIRIN